MERHLNKRTITVGFVVSVLLFFILSFATYQWLLGTASTHLQKVPISAKLILPSHINQPSDDMFFSGQNGVTELSLLKKIVPVAQDRSGLVVSINGRKADSAKHEYWAFLVNGKMATVGPADYVTKNTDKIEWKIEKY